MSNPLICQHDQLKRQCPLCDLEEGNAELRQEIEQLKAENAVLREFVKGTSDFARQCIAKIGGPADE